MTPAFSLENVTKRFRRADGSWNRAIQEVTFSVRAGESVAVIGPSGAGKTTLFRLLNLTLRPDEGRVLVEGTDPDTLGGRELRGLRARTATIFQEHHLVPSLRVVHNVLAGRLSSWSFFRALYSMAFPQERERVAEALERVGLLEKFWERADRLSVGQQQRVGLARGLIQGSRHIIADEPVASLDPSLSDALIALLRKINEDEGITLLVNLHDVSLALRHFPRVIGLHDGRILFDSPPEEVDEDSLFRLYEGDEEVMGDPADWLKDSLKAVRPA